MKEMTIVVRVFATVAVDAFIPINNEHPIDALTQDIERMRACVSNRGLLQACADWGAEFEFLYTDDREPEVKDADSDNDFEFVDSFIDKVKDSDWYNEDDPDDDGNDEDNDEGNTADISQEAATRLIQSLLAF